MIRILYALVLFVLAAFGAGQLRDDYRDGRMTIAFDPIKQFVFDRVEAPAFFWGLTAVNLAIVVGMMLGGILLVAVGVGR